MLRELPVREVSRGQHPHEVARRAAEFAGRCAADPRMRAVVLSVLGPRLGESALTGRPTRDVAARRGETVPAALHAWSRQQAHVREPARFGEFLSAPWVTSTFRAGDCDDLAVAVCAVAVAVGLPAAVLVLWTGPALAHVLPVVGANWVDAIAATIVIDADSVALRTLDEHAFRGARLFPVS